MLGVVDDAADDAIGVALVVDGAEPAECEVVTVELGQRAAGEV